MATENSVPTLPTGSLESRRKFITHSEYLTFGVATMGIMLPSTVALADGCDVESWGDEVLGNFREKVEEGKFGVLIVITGGVVFSAGYSAAGLIIVAAGVMGLVFPGIKKAQDEILDELKKKIDSL